MERLNMLTSHPATHAAPQPLELHGLDTPERVCFYEQDFYVLSNFSSFTLAWKTGPYLCQRFATSEQAYHWEKFNHLGGEGVQRLLDDATSAHEAFGIAQKHKALRRADWDDVKVDVMRKILRAKADQHEYVRRKLLATGDRELVENSWRDDYWGWGPNRDGQNMLGKLWMEVRAELRSAAVKKAHTR
ncbi:MULTISPECIES: NADAR family protein [unclassified Variovorax]|uniref:NADAR family protein n=1 Tax=unclassified Variovorax TaxID=663243 RepID=UPI003F490947